MSVRLQKLIAEAGIASRRQAEQWIREGRITVAGRPAKLGDRAEARDEVCLDGRRLSLDAEPGRSPEVLLYHKPVGEVTTRRDPQARPTVFDRLPHPQRGRWIVVGRLDVNTSGLLLFTTDGDLAHRLMHPSRRIAREYRVRLRGRPAPATLERLRRGVTLEDGPAAFDRIVDETPAAPENSSRNASYRVVLHEGRNREVRRMWEAAGHQVSRLMRIRYGPIALPRDLTPGTWRLADRRLTELLAAAAGTGGAGGKPEAEHAAADA